MLLWIIALLCVLAAAFALFWPLLRRSDGSATEKDDTTLIYARQLAELEHEVAGGRIGADEAETIRRETGRRMIAASKSAKLSAASARQPRPLLFGALVAGAAAAAMGFYLHWGSPDASTRIGSDMARLEGATAEELIAILTRRMVESPEDAKGWMLLGNALAERERYSEAAQAFARAIAATADPDAKLLGDYGEAATAAEGGNVPPEAIVAFERARAKAPMDPRPRLYLAMAQEQLGDRAGAQAALEALLSDSAPDAPWRPMVERQLARLAGEGPVPEVSEADIRAMVEGLAAKLAENPDDLDGWLMLIRAYGVLGETAKAEEALARARIVFANDAAALERLNSPANGH